MSPGVQRSHPWSLRLPSGSDPSACLQQVAEGEVHGGRPSLPGLWTETTRLPGPQGTHVLATRSPGHPCASCQVRGAFVC